MLLLLQEQIAITKIQKLNYLISNSCDLLFKTARVPTVSLPFAGRGGNQRTDPPLVQASAWSCFPQASRLRILTHIFSSPPQLVRVVQDVPKGIRNGK
jgi:hypothetical protein